MEKLFLDDILKTKNYVFYCVIFIPFFLSIGTILW